jgi:hypothetical protein
LTNPGEPHFHSAIDAALWLGLQTSEKLGC